MNAEQKEDLRHACLEFLATRHPAAYPVKAVLRKVRDEVDFNPADGDVENTCHFLVGMGLARLANDPLGSTKYFAATTDGVLAHERGFSSPIPPAAD